jgi:hypothetical protein
MLSGFRSGWAAFCSIFAFFTTTSELPTSSF